MAVLRGASADQHDSRGGTSFWVSGGLKDQFDIRSRVYLSVFGEFVNGAGPEVGVPILSSWCCLLGDSTVAGFLVLLKIILCCEPHLYELPFQCHVHRQEGCVRAEHVYVEGTRENRLFSTWDQCHVHRLEVGTNECTPMWSTCLRHL